LIRKKTTLILGAGASKYFGYPIGEELFKKILEICSNKSPEYKILELFTKSDHEINNFREVLLNSGKCSIDEFLEYRKEYDLIGKCAISLALIPFESHHKLFNGGSNENWYKYLFKIMNTDCTVDTFPSNQISFITFNYDRSLEHFLFTSIKNSFQDMDDEKCAQIMKNFPIIHLHGTLGSLPYINNDIQKEFESVDYNPEFSKFQNGISYRAYSPTTDYNIIKDCNQNLKIIHDNQDNRILESATDLLQDSDRIYFLGFGYNSKSLSRLNISKLSPNKIIAGTAFGMGKIEISKVSSDTNDLIKVRKLYNCGIVEFFKNYESLS